MLVVSPVLIIKRRKNVMKKPTIKIDKLLSKENRKVFTFIQDADIFIITS